METKDVYPTLIRGVSWEAVTLGVVVLPLFLSKHPIYYSLAKAYPLDLFYIGFLAPPFSCGIIRCDICSDDFPHIS